MKGLAVATLVLLGITAGMYAAGDPVRPYCLIPFFFGAITAVAFVGNLLLGRLPR